MADNNQNDQSLPELPVNVKRLPKLGHTIKLSIDDREIIKKNRATLVKHLGVESIESLDAKLVFKPWARDGVQVDGEIVSVLHSQCPVTLLGVEQQLHCEFNAKFVPPQSRLAKPPVNEEGEMIVDFDGEDIPDIYEGESLDAWEIVMEYLMLEIDYFARLKDATFEHQPEFQPSNEEKLSPFAELKVLKK